MYYIDDIHGIKIIQIDKNGIMVKKKILSQLPLSSINESDH